MQVAEKNKILSSKRICANKLLQPTNLKRSLLRGTKTECKFANCRAFRMLPKVLEMPELGTSTMRHSFLTIVVRTNKWAIINGETKTGVTFFIDDKIDTGDDPKFRN
jgi:methionyl-tRNA formyltransferase